MTIDSFPMELAADRDRGAQLATGRTTVIDIGSNSGRAVVIQPRPGGHLEVVEELRLPLRLGAALDDEGRLNAEAVERLNLAVEDFLAIARAAGSERVLAIGTSALRRATNGPAILDGLRERYGVELRVIDGELEGHYAFLGAVHGLPVERGMLIDIGGGSVELARFEDRAVTGLWSFPLGTLSSGARFLQDDPPTNGQIDRLREAVVEAMEEAGVPRLGRRERLVGTGGAIRNVAKVDRRRRRRVYPVPRLHGYEMRRGRVEKVANLLRSMPASERGGIPGLNPSRAETIVAGATLLETVMATLKTRVMVVSGQGLREGVVRATLGELPPAELAGGLPDPRSVRRASIRAVAGRFTQIDEGAAQRRGWAALELLDRTESTVSAQLRELIGYTATMVDVGTAIDFYNRESVAAQIVMETDLAGFSHLMIAEFASLLQLLEDPRFDVHRFAPLLSADERGGLDLAATALTLAFELHRRIPPHAVGLVATSATEETITIEVPGSIGRLPAPLVERVERTFKRKLQVVRRRED